MYKNTWIVVANASKARIFQAISNETLEEHDTLLNPEARIKGTNLTSDRPGRAFDSTGAGRHALETAHGGGDEPTEEFSRQVNEHLYDLDNKGVVNQIYLFASPEFLGILRKHVPQHLQPKISGTVDKDLTRLPPNEIRDYLPEVM